jgi:prolyl oligopeptidase
MPLTPWVLRNNYPPARRSDTVNVYNSEARGEVRVQDPYQWLEEDSEETEQWTTAQAAHTRSYLDENPDRQRLEDEIRANTDYAKV